MVIVVPEEVVRVEDGDELVVDPGVWYGQIGTLQYWLTIPRDVIEAGPAWAPSKPLPMSIARAVTIARTTLAKAFRRTSLWQVDEISLQRLRHSDPERWFFIVSFVNETGKRSEQGTMQVPVAFNGRTGVVNRVKR
jgi:hypothetical protein